MTNTALLQMNRINKRFEKHCVLQDTEIELYAGECVLLCGDNGAGKTTLLRILAGLERPDTAQVADNTGTRSWRRSRKALLGLSVYLHQTAYMFDGSVSDNLAHALPRPLQQKECRRDQIKRALDWAGLNAFAKVPARSLSGGERQRVALARAWLSQARLLLLDEPTTSMDHSSKQRTLELLHALKAEGHTLLLASHEPAHFLPLSDRRLNLCDGQIQTVISDLYPEAVSDLPLNVTPLRRKFSC